MFNGIIAEKTSLIMYVSGQSDWQKMDAINIYFLKTRCIKTSLIAVNIKHLSIFFSILGDCC